MVPIQERSNRLYLYELFSMDLKSFSQQNTLRRDLPVINNLGFDVFTVNDALEGEVSKGLLSRAWGGTRIGVRFIVTTLLIFGVVQVSLNFPAYKAQYDFFREKQLSIKDPKKEILKSLQKTPVQNNASTTQIAQAASNNVEDSFALRTEVINFHDFEVAPSDNRIVIGKIGKNVPTVEISPEKLMNKDYSGLEKEIQDALLRGIVHYPGTAKPGEIGNVFYTGHSSNYVWVDSDYNNVLALLQELVVGDKVTTYWEGKKFIYQVYDIKVVSPKDTWVLQQSGNEYPSIMTLMTCTPVGTSLNRLIIRSKQIYPEPALNGAPQEELIGPPSALISS